MLADARRALTIPYVATPSPPLISGGNSHPNIRTSISGSFSRVTLWVDLYVMIWSQHEAETTAPTAMVKDWGTNVNSYGANSYDESQVLAVARNLFLKCVLKCAHGPSIGRSWKINTLCVPLSS